VTGQLTHEHREVLRLMRARDWRVALQIIDDALQQAPMQPAFLMHRAQCLMALGERGDALAAVQSALRQAPSDAVLWDAAGTLYSIARRFSITAPACAASSAILAVLKMTMTG